MKRKRCGGATGRPTLIQLEIPHITQGRESIRSHDTRLRYQCLKCLKKRSSHIFRSFRPLRSCAVGNAEDVRLRFYRQFRLCFTTTDFGGRKGIGLSPYPYAVGVTSSLAKETSRRCLRRHITLPKGNISHLTCEIYHSYQKGIKLFGEPKRH